NIHRPTFPDGIDGTGPGPLSTPIARWSPFNDGFQLDLVYNQLVKGVLGDASEGCAGRAAAGSTAPDAGIAKLRNGAQIFPGGVPIYRGTTLVGAVGVSGDGVDQDDMIASLGLANAAKEMATGLGHAPTAMRADTLAPQGVRLRYIQCPQSPFNGSNEENVCAGI
ncbi:MAG TPA: heme-binding protein, partial [Usitatibacter sp.]|nr:heme-binding protein [Usitatibacter sp.]